MAGFSDRARAIKPTGIRRMFDMAGDDAIQFGLGEPDFQPPAVAINEFHNAMLNGHNKYTSTGGLPELRRKIAESWQHLEPGLDESSVCMTMSGTNALLDIFLAIVNPDDEVLIPEPYFPLYPPDVTICGGRAITYPCRFENEFVPDVEDLEALVTDSTLSLIHISEPTRPC